MKYIRTKDGIFEVYKEKEDGYIIRTKPFLETANTEYYLNLFFSKERVIKAADTIEELCDEFVYRNELQGCTPKTHIIVFGETMFVEPPLKSKIAFIHKIYKDDLTNVYGEIWVDGELHKVAKMNEKGELELL